VDEKLSEYIRKSVEDRNKKVLGRVKKWILNMNMKLREITEIK
jgi:hypothetical protein